MKTHTGAGGVRHWYFYAGIGLAALIGLVLLLLLGVLIYLTVTEYKPQAEEPAWQLERGNTAAYAGETLKVLSWNTGYAGLGAEADFILDGGTQGTPERESLVSKNEEGIAKVLEETQADIYLLQEVDRDSGRTYHHNQWERYADALGDYQSCFALNYECGFVPFPVTDPIGKVSSGLATYSRYTMENMVRRSLPVPFSWPVRAANLKRCLLVSRIPVEGTDKELVIVNLHLEAYDDGEGKAVQTQQLTNLLIEEYEKGNYVIAGGDFNQFFAGSQQEVKPTSQWVPGYLDALPEGWDYLYDDATPTCRLLNQPYDPASELTQYYVIDGFIVSPNLQVLSVETLDEGFTYSDHNPVLLQVKPKEPLNKSSAAEQRIFFPIHAE